MYSDQLQLELFFYIHLVMMQAKLSRLHFFLKRVGAMASLSILRSDVFFLLTSVLLLFILHYLKRVFFVIYSNSSNTAPTPKVTSPVLIQLTQFSGPV